MSVFLIAGLLSEGGFVGPDRIPSGQVIPAADAGHPEAHSVYGWRWPRIRVDAQAMLARMHHLDAAGSAGE